MVVLNQNKVRLDGLKLDDQIKIFLHLSGLDRPPELKDPHDVMTWACEQRTQTARRSALRFKDTKEIHDFIIESRRREDRLSSRATAYAGSFGVAEIFTDGACDPNPGAGGWGFILNVPGCELIEHYGGAADTTNNRMEMTAVLQAMHALPQGITGVIHSDSQYVIKGLTVWMHGWHKNGWKRAARNGGEAGPVLNLDIWQALWEARFRRSFEYKWIRGHNGHKWNERADELAEMGRQAHMAGKVAAIEIPAAVMPSVAAPPPRLAV